MVGSGSQGIHVAQEDPRLLTTSDSRTKAPNNLDGEQITQMFVRSTGSLHWIVVFEGLSSTKGASRAVVLTVEVKGELLESKADS